MQLKHYESRGESENDINDFKRAKIENLLYHRKQARVPIILKGDIPKTH